MDAWAAECLDRLQFGALPGFGRITSISRRTVDARPSGM
jgi:hypothetical protein